MRQIAFKIVVFCSLLSIISCSQQTKKEEIPHYLRKDNFTVLRVIIKNDDNQILMVGGNDSWGMPYVNLSKRQFLKEAIDSMALEHGIRLADIELRGQFAFKYDYKPNMTFRNYYVAQFKSGKIKVPKNNLEDEFEKIEWVDIPEAIERNNNTGIQEITRQILNNPDVVWGGSFMVSHTVDDHPTKIVEPFYPLYKKEINQ
ncbi:NUDIX hydrolase [Croceivirga thetidis]|uniref:NUDIX hydrolase n=1 Tax=Croceivirga thetidis TaxID=2721623 RepID=A0ABX1GN33_9FLAO|nr:NUDIX hydrolase [Croceivirga thetidis]NKI31068.1 NUDIX hydrolase [Croceivirga thetidis]